MGIEIIGKLTQKNNGDFKLVDLENVDYDGTGKSAKQELERKIQEAKNTSTPYDDTEIKQDITNIQNDLGTEELTTTAKNIKAAINEHDSQIKENVKNINHKISKLQIKKGFVAHRGLVSKAPENTLKAIHEAGRNGFVMCELDPHITSDGIWILMHDDNIDRMTNGTGNVANMTYAELQNYYIDTPSAQIDEDEIIKIPTLEDAIKVCSYYDMGVNLDGNKFRWDEEKIAYFYSLLKKYDIYEKSFISLPVESDRDMFLNYLPQFPICIAISSIDIDNFINNALQKYNNIILAFQCSDLTEDAIKKCNELNIPIYVWNAQITGNAYKWLYNGISFVETDYILPEGSVL